MRVTGIIAEDLITIAILIAIGGLCYLIGSIISGFIA